MKSLLGIGVGAVVVLCGLYWLFSPDSPVTNYPAAAGTIVAFGDSLVTGYGSTPGNDMISQTEVLLEREIVNLGVSGDTTKDGLARLDEVLAQDPQLVILLLGGNDALQNVPAQDTFANLGSIIEQIHDSGAMVLLLGVRGGLLSDSYANRFEQLAQTYNTAFVPNVLAGVFTRPQLMFDRIHPNDDGYAIIAQRVAAEAKGLLEE